MGLGNDVDGSGGGLYDAGMWQERLELCAEIEDIRRDGGYSQRSGYS